MTEDVKKYDLKSTNLFILHKQHLTEDTKTDDVFRITQDIGGLHATSATTPYLSLLARSNTFAREDLEEELYRKKSLARIRYVRNTMYILPKGMLPVAFAAVQKNTKKMTEQHMEYLRLSSEEYEKISEEITELLKPKGLSIHEIKAELGAIPNLSYILRMMCFHGRLIRGKPKAGWKSNLHTYFPFQAYYPGLQLRSVDEEEAQETVIRQYLSAFGPVTENDIVWWTGFTKGQVGRILKRMNDEMKQIEIAGLNGQHFILASQEKKIKSAHSREKTTVNILPTLDPYLMGYKDRDRFLYQKYFTYVYDRSGNATPTILLDGIVAGVWELEETVFKYFLFYDVAEEVLEKIHLEAERTGRFISGQDIQLKECDHMRPLIKRTAGGVMTPLKDC
jgi:hypothetical protein